MSSAGPICSVFALSLVLIPLGLSAPTSAQEAVQGADPGTVAVAPVVPQQVRYSGKLATRAGDTVEAVFRIYASAEGGEPLWTETQKISMAEDGSYSVLLGSADPKGLPQTVFAGGVARWLGVSVERGAESDRVMLASVPYAMKSADAEALAGHAASDFVTQEQLSALALQSSQASQANQSTNPTPAFSPETSGTVTGSGTTGTIPIWTGTLTQGNSNMVQVGSEIGINETTPAAMLDVNGTEAVRGELSLPTTGTATTAKGYPSQTLQFGSSLWSTTAAAPVAQNFSLATIPVGNDTATPSASLLFQYQSGTSAPAGILSIGSTGLISFASGQLFPGTITGAIGTTPLIAGVSGHNITVQLDETAMLATFNATYAQLSNSNSFTGSQSIKGGLSLTAGLTAQSSAVTGYSTAVEGFKSNGAIAATPASLATSTAAQNSPQLQLGASAYNSGSAAAVAQTYAWQTQVSGNDTASPTANLALLFGSGTGPAATGLSIASNGAINFSPHQTFPITGTGGGTITGITTTSPLTGSGTAGSVALGLNATALETTLDGVYPQLSTGNIFSSYLEAYQTAGAGNAALLGWGSNGSVGTFGDSDTGYGLQGESTSGFGTYSQVTTPAAGSAGVLGFTGTGFSATYSAEAGVANAGVWADTSTAGSGIPLALLATADDAYAAALITNGADFPALFADNNNGTAAEFTAASGYGVTASTSSGTGVYGSTSASGNGVEGIVSNAVEQENGVLGVANTSSGTGTVYNIYAGVQGDTGTSSTSVAPAWAIGVLGTADDSHAGVFLNNSSGWSTLYVENYDSGGTGLFKTFMAADKDGTCGIGSGGNLSCTGQIKTLVDAGDGASKVETYAVQSPENWMEDFGSGELKSGVAVITIDRAFSGTVTADASYHVFLTPNGDSKGLYVIAKTPNTFEVRESGGGTSSLTFDYRIVAKRRGFEAQRLVDVTERFNAEQKASTMARTSGIKRKPMIARKSPLIAALNSRHAPIAAGRTPIAKKPMIRPAVTPHS